MIETDWGKPLHFVVTSEGDIQKFSTLEQARHWLRRKWPVADDNQHKALSRIDEARHCVSSIGTARRAFIAAARSAGFKRQDALAV